MILRKEEKEREREKLSRIREEDEQAALRGQKKALERKRERC